MRWNALIARTAAAAAGGVVEEGVRRSIRGWIGLVAGAALGVLVFTEVQSWILEQLEAWAAMWGDVADA